MNLLGEHLRVLMVRVKDIWSWETGHLHVCTLTECQQVVGHRLPNEKFISIQHVANVSLYDKILTLYKNAFLKDIRCEGKRGEWGLLFNGHRVSVGRRKSARDGWW